MTSVSSIITDAYREANLITINGTPTGYEQSEALRLLNEILLSSVGNEVGDDLTDIIIGGTNDQSYLCDPTIPPNCRLVLNLAAPTTLKLNASPVDGQRFAIIDTLGNLSTYNLTIDANGRTIELDNTELFNTDGFQGQWLYFADIGDWTRITTLLLTDDMPFPNEFDTYFITMLALRLAPRNGSVMPQDSIMALKRARANIHARYSAARKIRPDTPLYFLTHSFYWADSSTAFNTGNYPAWPFFN